MTMIRLIAMFIFLVACSNTNTKKLLLKQQINLGGEDKLFWFVDASSITSEGVSYFQIGKATDELCTKNANAYCDVALQIHKIEHDTIYVLASTKLISLKKSNYVFRVTDYVPELFDKSKRLNRADFLLIEEHCKKK